MIIHLGKIDRNMLGLKSGRMKTAISVLEFSVEQMLGEILTLVVLFGDLVLQNFASFLEGRSALIRHYENVEALGGEISGIMVRFIHLINLAFRIFSQKRPRLIRSHDFLNLPVFDVGNLFLFGILVIQSGPRHAIGEI